jgi:DNA-binding NtrC family response regulator
MDQAKILIVDDEVNLLESLGDLLSKKGYDVATANDGLEALGRLDSEPFQVMIADLRMPGMSGLELLEKVNSQFPDMSVLILTAYGTIKSAVTAVRMGAYDYICKPFMPEEILTAITNILEQKRLFHEYEYEFEKLIGKHPSMREVYKLISQVSKTNCTVLILGESGTGKELAAYAIHHNSDRRSKPFIKVSCAALPEGVLESELFGHERGAFTNAYYRRKGRFELAHGGTLLLDEIGDMPMATQVKLLRVLQEREFERVGGNQTIKVDVRIVATTNRDLTTAVSEQQFREDLYYRLSVVPIHLPPLRERKGDIPLLIGHFLKKFGEKDKKKVSNLSRDALSLLMAYDWPGNVRELENAVERAVVLSKGDTIIPDYLPRHIRDTSGGGISLWLRSRSLREAERQLLTWVLERTDWNIKKAADILKISRGTLYSKIRKLDLRDPRS